VIGLHDELHLGPPQRVGVAVCVGLAAVAIGQPQRDPRRGQVDRARREQPQPDPPSRLHLAPRETAPAPAALPAPAPSSTVEALPSAADIELSFYEAFFFQRGLEPYAVQEAAFAHIFAGDSTMVTVPTGTGKTMMAKAAIHKALALGQRAIYTTPLRALTEEKHRELSEDFGADRVGFATGDYKVNPDAPVQVVVAEILWNRIFGDRLHAPADVVVMDEGHYFNDPERGYVWEQSVIALDPRTQLIILSATVGHADRFCHWIEIVRRMPMRLVESRDRRVPLYHEFREAYLVEVVRELAAAGDVSARLTWSRWCASWPPPATSRPSCSCSGARPASRPRAC